MDLSALAGALVHKMARIVCAVMAKGAASTSGSGGKWWFGATALRRDRETQTSAESRRSMVETGFAGLSSRSPSALLR